MTPNAPSRRSRILLAAAVAAVGLALDLATKQWAWETLRDGTEIAVIDGVLYFEFGFNTGAAFSLLRDAGWARYFFMAVTLGAVAYMIHLARTLPTRWPSAFVAIGLITSGALGNLHDRIFRAMPMFGKIEHGVVDFIKVYYWPGKPWPTFNIADVNLVLGVGLLLLYMSRHGEAIEDADEAAPEDEGAAAPASGAG